MDTPAVRPLPLDAGPVDRLTEPHQDKDMPAVQSDTLRSRSLESVNHSPQISAPWTDGSDTAREDHLDYEGVRPSPMGHPLDSCMASIAASTCPTQPETSPHCTRPEASHRNKAKEEPSPCCFVTKARH